MRLTMRFTAMLILCVTPCALAQIAAPTTPARYLPSIQQRWDASDLVCIGDASAPTQTGLIQNIDGRDRDQLSAQIEIESCFKGDRPKSLEIRVLGDDVVAAKDTGHGYGYSGPPTGFLSKGRNLLFLRRKDAPGDFVVTIPVYQTNIPLADSRPAYSATDTRHVLTQELEAAVAQFDARDLSYINYLFDLLGERDAIAELERFSPNLSLPVQRDIAVSLLNRDQQDSEPVVISLLLDASSPAWKRENAAMALGRHGTRAALAPLQQIASQPISTDDLKPLQTTAQSLLPRLKQRLGAQ
jgi:hypothetical protein